MPFPTSSIPEMSRALKDFENISKHAVSAMENLKKADRNMEELANHPQQTRVLLDLMNEEKRKKDAYWIMPEAKIRDADIDKQNSVQKLEAKTAGMKDKIEGECHTDIGNIVEALSMVFMFPNPESVSFISCARVLHSNLAPFSALVTLRQKL